MERNNPSVGPHPQVIVDCNDDNAEVGRIRFDRTGDDAEKVLRFRLKHHTSLPIKDPIVGWVEVDIETLLSQSSETEEVNSEYY